MRTVLFVPPSMPASDLMARMQASRTQMALVIDEYGGTDGLVSLEDIVEMVVGDIEDEHDDEETLITQPARASTSSTARPRSTTSATVIGEDFAAGEHGEYVDTIGGMIFNTLGRVPGARRGGAGDPGFEFQVLDADPRARQARAHRRRRRTRERRRQAARAEQPRPTDARSPRRHAIACAT